MALAYEVLVVSAIALVAGLVFHRVTDGDLSGAMRHLFQLYLFLVLGAYFVACWTRGGRTLPMQTWRIRVVRDDGMAIGIGRATLRYALAWLSLVPLGAGFFWAFFDREGQFLHDRLAGTRMIVDAETGGWGSRARKIKRNSPGL